MYVRKVHREFQEWKGARNYILKNEKREREREREGQVLLETDKFVKESNGI
jgi:hypothetical protein